LELVRKLIPSVPRVLDIQDELVDQGKKLVDTSAGRSVNEEWKRTLEKYEKDMQVLKEELHEALASGSEEMKEIIEQGRNEMAARIKQLRTARRKLRNMQSPAKALLYINELGLLPDREALLIYVKGTMEIGNVGLSGSLFSSMFDSHAQIRSKLAIQGVYYNPVKSVFSVFSGGSRRATQKVLSAVKEGIKCSPSKRIFLCGA
jgi:hypothetical protein